MDFGRKKSCGHCRLAKTRCSIDTPQCTRCKHRNLICKYEYRFRDHSKHPRDETLFHSWPIDPNVVAHQKELNPRPTPAAVTRMSPIATGRPATLDFSLSPILDFEGVFSSGIDWSDPGIWETSGNLPEMTAKTPNEQRPSRAANSPGASENSSELEPKPHIPGHQDGAEILTKVSQAMNQTSDWKLMQVTWQSLNAHTPNLLCRNKETKLSSSIIGNYLWSKIVSYVADFGSSLLPPFIHNRC
jgi:hypothetical protein